MKVHTTLIEARIAELYVLNAQRRRICVVVEVRFVLEDILVRPRYGLM